MNFVKQLNRIFLKSLLRNKNEKCWNVLGFTDTVHIRSVHVAVFFQQKGQAVRTPVGVERISFSTNCACVGGCCYVN